MYVAVAVPPAVLRISVLAPVIPAGVTNVICVAEMLVIVPTALLMVTDAPSKLVPLMTVLTPPAINPALGVSDEIVGGATNVNALLVAAPAEVVATILVTPAAPAGVSAVICVSVTVALVTATPPTVTTAPVKFVPVMVIGVPPTVVPEVGLTAVIVGSEVLV